MRHELSDTDKEVTINEMFNNMLFYELKRIEVDYEQEGIPAIEIKDRLQSVYEEWEKHYRTEDTEHIDICPSELFNDEAIKGLEFPFTSLQSTIRPLIAGDFLILAARPDQGKTSLITFLCRHFAGQTQGRPIIWFNNEGPGTRILNRLYQTVLEMTSQEIVNLMKVSNGDQIQKEYQARLKGEIKIYDIHGKNIMEIEKIIQKDNPALVIYDMIDNICGAASDRYDLQLEKLYQTVREFGVKYDCINLATSQISYEGDDLEYPPMSALKDSKTGKQGTADLILMLGSKHDPQYQNTRWLSSVKNKLKTAGGSRFVLDVDLQKNTWRDK